MKSAVGCLLAVLWVSACAPEVAAPEPVAAVEESYCDAGGTGVNVDPTRSPCEKLSSYRLFKITASGREPNSGVFPFELNTPLFADYATARRFLWMPKGTTAHYTATGILKFPAGAVLAKTFSYQQGASERVIETRLLVNGPRGWVGLPYVWNAAMTEAVLHKTGVTIPTDFVDENGNKRSVKYVVPTSSQCKGCHKGLDGMHPIGTQAGNLNRDNQLAALAKAGYLTGLPDLADVPRMPVWNDAATTAASRARAYLDVNCAHCHNPRGLARTSGLDMSLEQPDPCKLGVCKIPLDEGDNHNHEGDHDANNGYLTFDILPSNPDQSILVFRLGSVKPGPRMPELGRTLVHTEGVKLLREWIASMPPDDCLD